MVLAYYEILGRLYSIRKTIIDFDTIPSEAAQLIGDLVQDMEET